jgi:5-hydroxyisourate hydrolase
MAPKAYLLIEQNTGKFFQKKLDRLFGESGFASAGAMELMSAATKGILMTGYLTTHVLDLGKGCPAQGLKIELYRILGSERVLLKTLVTNADGRTDQQILPREEFQIGEYELVFHAGAYLDATGVPPEEPRFLNLVPLRFGMSSATHYHVPLLLSPFGYTTYRGS